MTIREFEGRRPQVSDSAYVDDTALVIGEVSIGAASSLWPMVVARGDVNAIVIGARTNIQDGSILHVTHPGEVTEAGFALSVGDSVTVGHRVVLHGCTIGSYCLIGMAATVLDGAVVADRSVIGAGALVPPGKQLEPGYLWLGTPVRRARPLTDKELELLEYSAEHYIELKERHRQATA